MLKNITGRHVNIERFINCTGRILDLSQIDNLNINCAADIEIRAHTHIYNIFVTIYICISLVCYNEYITQKILYETSS